MNSHAVIPCMVLACAAPFVSAASDVDDDALRERIEQAVVEWMDSRGEAGAPSLPVRIETPARHVADAGIVFDGTWEPRVDSDGLGVLALRPGGAAARMGLRAGDRIVAVNGIALRHLGATEDGRARAADVLTGMIADVVPGEPLALDIRRGGSTHSVGGALDSRYIPPIQLVLGQAVLAGADDTASTPGSRRGCGVISTFALTPRAGELYPAMVVGIDGSEWYGRNTKTRWSVPAGTYQVRVLEMISDPRLRVSSRQRGTSKVIELVVEPDRIYEIGARFDPDKRFRGIGGEYWEPVVWRTAERECTRVDFVPRPGSRDG